MKTLITASALLLSVCFTQAQTNVYQPYPLDNASWTFHTQYYNGMSNVENWVTEDWGGQIVINGETYTEVTGDDIIVGVRQDIPNEKVYYIDDQGVEHDASFDQSLQVGDTAFLTQAFRTLAMNPWIGGWVAWPGVDSMLVEQVDSVLVGTNYRKRIWLTFLPFNNTYQYDCTYICGVSCTNYTTFESGYAMDCFYVDGELYLGDPFNPFCTADVKEIPEETAEIHPNPSDGHFFITYDGSSPILAIYVLDLTGKRIAHFDWINSKDGFDGSMFPSGMYIVELIFEKGSARSSLLIE